jgi:hypothetical protein
VRTSCLQTTGSVAQQAETHISLFRSIDLRFVDDLVDVVRGRGFVLDFSDPSISQFFATKLQVDIDDPGYADHGAAEGKRLRRVLQKRDDSKAVRAPKAP